ncbi:hypothetical protein FB451DRAFT_1412435 [Mycena latifolia]|nr:hypothetical protein FB451DRAFT_1412435 [Mycena latifolia]
MSKRKVEAQQRSDFTEGHNAPKKKSTAPESPSLAGKFDLYAMELPFLSEVYLPEGETKPQFGALYQTILKYQAKPDFTAYAALEDPMEGLPWDIALKDLARVDKLVFPPAERALFVTPPREGVPGITGRTGLARGHCGVQAASGVFRMQHAWTGSVGEQIFEGYHCKTHTGFFCPDF